MSQVFLHYLINFACVPFPAPGAPNNTKFKLIEKKEEDFAAEVAAQIKG